MIVGAAMSKPKIIGKRRSPKDGRTDLYSNKGRVTKEQAHARRDLARKVILAAGTANVFYEALNNEFRRDEERATATYGRALSKLSSHEIFEQERAKLVDDVKDAQPSARFEAIARVRNDLMRMKSVNKPNWKSVACHEDLLAELEGTKQAQKVQLNAQLELDVRKQSLIHIIDSMTLDEQRRVVIDYRNESKSALPPGDDD
jgi:septal ring factor EnvC (AmiA/AmiB activator)